MSTRTVETVLRVRDEMTPAMLKAGASAGKLAADVEKAGRSVDTLGKANTAGLAGGMDKTAVAAGKLDTATRKTLGGWKDLGQAAEQAGGKAATSLDGVGKASGRTEASVGKLRTVLGSLKSPDLDKIAGTFNDASAAADSARQKWQGVGDAGKVVAGAGTVMAAGLGAATKAAMDWEDAWTGVTKTVDGVNFDALEGDLRQLAKTMPVAHEEIAATAQAAGALGVAGPKIASFVKTALELGAAVDDMDAEEAATGIAQIANVMGTFNKPVTDGTENVDRFASALVHLGNNGASTEGQILHMAQRIAGAASNVGMSEQGVLAMSNTLASMGVKAELGGGVTSRALLKVNTAVMDGGEGLQAFADLAGTSADSFAQAWKSDPTLAMSMLADGMAKTKAEGGNLSAILGDLGFKGTEDQQVMLALASGHDVLTASIKDSNDAWTSGDKAQQEAAKRYATNSAQIKIAWNQVKDAAIEVGGAIAPVVASVAGGIGDIATAFGSLPDGAQQAIGLLGGVATAATVLGGAAMMAAPGIAATHAALTSVAASSPLAAAGLGAVGLAAKGLGIAGLAIGGAVVAAELDKIYAGAVTAKPGVDALSSSLAGLGSGANAAAFQDLMALPGVFDPLGTKPRTAAEALDAFGASAQNALSPTVWDRVNFMGHADAVGQFGEQAKQLDAAFAQMVASGNVQGAAQAWQQLADAAKAQGVPIEELEAKFPQYAAAVTAAGDASKGAIPGVAGLDGATQELDTSINAAGVSVKELDEAIKRLMGAFSVEEATDSWSSSLRDLSGTLKGVKGNVDANSEAGEKARGAMRSQVQAAGDLLSAMAKNGAGHASLSKKAEELARDLENTGAKAGISKEEMKRYTGAIRDVPKQVSTDVEANTAEAQDDIEAFKRKLEQIDRAVKVWVTVGYRSDGSPLSGGGGGLRIPGPAMATGGPIVGPGTATSDSIPALLSNGEHVLTAAEVKAAGGQASILRLRKAMLAGDVPRFATGGPVGASGSASLQQAVITAALGSGRNAIMVDVTANITKVIAPTRPVEIAAVFQWDAKTKAMLAGPSLTRDIAGLEAPKMSPNVAALMTSWGSVLQTIDAAVQDQAALDQKIKDAAKGLQEAEDVLAQAGADLAKAQATYPGAAADAAFRAAESAAKDAKNARANAAEELGEWRKAKTDITKAQREYVKAQASLAALTKANASFERLAPARSKVKVTKKAVDDAKALVAQEQREYAAARKVATIAGQQEKTARAKWAKEQAKGGTSGGKSGSVSYSGALGSSAAKPYRAAIIAAGAKYGVAPELLAAQLKAESGFNPKARSHAGARGIAQFMPGTARGVGLKNPLDPIASINAQAKLMGGYAKTYKGDIAKMLAAYNAGPGNVKRWQKISETRNYVAKIKADAGVKSMGKAANTYNPKAIAKATSGAKAGANPLVESMIDNAQKLVGRYYKWGGGHAGSSHKSNLDKALVDCSGLINTALGHTLKKNVNRVAKDWTKGKGVKKLSVAEALKTRGAFLGTDAHVVMSLGDGRVIEAPQTGKKVRITSAKGRKFSRGGWYTGLGTPGAAGVTGKGGAFNIPGYNATARGDALEVLDPRKAKESRDQAKAARDAKAKELADAKKAAAENARRAAQVAQVRAEMEKALPQIAALAIAGDEATKALEENKKAQDELRPTFDALKGALDKAKEAARQFGDSIASAITGASSVGKLWTMEGGGNRSPESIAMQRGIDITNAKKFAADIDKLSKLGLNKTDLADIMTMGVNDGGALAHSIVSSSSSAILGLNRSREELDEVAAKIGAAFGQDIYGEQIADATADLAPIAAGMDILVKEPAGLTKLISDLEAQRLKIGEAVAGKIDALIGVQRTQGTELQRMWQQWMGSYGLNAKSAPGLTGVGTTRPTLAPPARPVQVTVQPAKVDLNGARLVIHTDKGGFEATVTNVIAAAVQQAQVKAGGGVR